MMMLYGPKETEQAAKIGEALRFRGLTISTAESITGGGLSSCLVSVPGSSSWFKGSAVAYRDEIKHALLGVPTEILERNGAVSEECVEAMAEGARKLFMTDLAVAVSGIAGPDGDGSSNPIGTVWIAVALPSRTITRRRLFKGGREDVRRETILEALGMIWKEII